MAAAIAAGETPSPEMVAASGEKTGLRFSVAVALLVIVCIGSLVATQLVSQLSLMQRVPLGKSRDVLIERAKEIIEAAGYPPGTDTAFGFDYEMELIQYFRKAPYSDNRWKKLEGLNPVRFWYRQSSHALEHRIIDTASPRSVEVISRLTPSNAPLEYAGEIFVGLDSSGRLREFKAIPLQDQSSIASAPGLDWSQLLSKAGVDAVRWGSVKPETIPLYYADERTAYQGTFATAPDIPMRIEAASYGGRLVSFEVSGPWNVQERRSAPRPTSESVANAVVVLFISVCLLGGSVFARRNLRLGRGDRRAATRLSLFVFSSISVSWLFAEHHVGTLWELYLFVFGFLGFALFLSGVIWILYIAFEPFVRRRWPQVLVAWTRVMSKQWRDPVVGGHMLVGSAVGVCLACAFGLMSVAPTWFGHPAGNRILLSTLFPLAGAGSFISVLVYLPTVALGTAVDILFFLYLLRIIFKNELIATILMTLAFGATILPSDEAWLAVPAALVITAVFLFVLNRLGLLALVVAYFVYLLFVTFPMTLDASNWYFGTSFAALLVVLTIALYGFRISIGNRALLDFVRAEN